MVLNPVRAGLVEQPQDWIWSSYAATAGFVARPRLLTTSLVLGTPTVMSWRDYRAFVVAGIPESRVTASLRSDVLVIGSDAFASAHRDAIEQAHRTEVLRRDRLVGRPTLEEVFADIREKSERSIRIREARDRFHYRVSEIANHLSLHYGTVSRIAAAAARGGRPSEVSAQHAQQSGD